MSAIVDLLKAETAHEQTVSQSADRVIIPIDLQSDTEIIDQLVRRAMRAAPWPIVESERGRRLARRAAEAFLREMDGGHDLHRMGFYMLRNRGFIPVTATLDGVSAKPNEERTAFLNATLKKYGFGPVGSVLRKM